MNNPYGKGIIRLMYDGDILIGHYAATPPSFKWVKRILRRLCR